MKRGAEREHQLGLPSVVAQCNGRAGQMPPVSWIETKHNKPIRNKNKLDSGSGGMYGAQTGKNSEITAIRCENRKDIAITEVMVI